MTNLTSVADAVAGDPMFHHVAGKPVTRDRSCECGKRFTQLQLSERFMLIVERKSKNAAALVAKQIPDLFVPVHCPKCERRDLARQAQLDDVRQIPPNYLERVDHAAD